MVLKGRKGSRYLEFIQSDYSWNNDVWRASVGDDVDLNKVKFVRYEKDYRGDDYDAAYFSINDEEIKVCESRQFKNTADAMALGYMFDEIKEQIGCGDDSDETARNIILENYRLVKILDKNGLVDLAKQIDKLELENKKYQTTNEVLQKQLEETEKNLEFEKQAHADVILKITELNRIYSDFKSRLFNTVKEAIDGFKL